MGGGAASSGARDSLSRSELAIGAPLRRHWRISTFPRAKSGDAQQLVLSPPALRQAADNFNLLEQQLGKSRSPPRAGLAYRSEPTGETRDLAIPSFPGIRPAVKRSISADREGLCRIRAERTALQLVLPRHLRPRREKIFGAAPSHHLDGNAKARVWAAASAYNTANRRPGQPRAH